MAVGVCVGMGAGLGGWGCLCGDGVGWVAVYCTYVHTVCVCAYAILPSVSRAWTH